MTSIKKPPSPSNFALLFAFSGSPSSASLECSLRYFRSPSPCFPSAPTITPLSRRRGRPARFPCRRRKHDYARARVLRQFDRRTPPDLENGVADVDLTSIPARTRPPTCDDPQLQALLEALSDSILILKRANILADFILRAVENCSNRGIEDCGQSVTGKRGMLQAMALLSHTTNSY